jgi:hypothetical protein
MMSYSIEIEEFGFQSKDFWYEIIQRRRCAKVVWNLAALTAYDRDGCLAYSYPDHRK